MLTAPLRQFGARFLLPLPGGGHAFITEHTHGFVMGGLQIVPFGLPRGSLAACDPECNPLLPLWHHARESHGPAAKSVPVRAEA